MTSTDRPRGLQPSGHWGPYLLIGVSLPLGLLVFGLQPLPSRTANLVAASGLLAIGIAGVTYLIARHAGPDERRPDF